MNSKLEVTIDNIDSINGAKDLGEAIKTAFNNLMEELLKGANRRIRKLKIHITK